MKTKIIRLMVFFLTFSFNVAMCQEGNREAVLKDLSFDKKTGTISYELTVPARVRIRIGIVEGPLYRTIVDWQERGTGKHKEEWNGMDALGTFKLAGREDLVFTFNYFTAGGEYLRNIQVMDILPLAGNLTGRNLPNLEVNRMHKKHYRQFCHEPKIEIRLPKNIRRNKDNFYIVKEKIPIEISLVGEDKSWFRAERYSLHIFVDDVFAQGELDGYSPYTWIFDPKGLNEGKHLIVVNLAGFNDHYGIASLPVYIHSSKNTKTVNKAGRISYGTKNKKL